MVRIWADLLDLKGSGRIWINCGQMLTDRGQILRIGPGSDGLVPDFDRLWPDFDDAEPDFHDWDMVLTDRYKIVMSSGQILTDWAKPGIGRFMSKPGLRMQMPVT